MIQSLADDFKSEDSDILGREYYDGSRFWVANSRGDWVDLDKETFRSRLGIMKDIATVPKGESDADAKILEICLENRVNYVGRLAGYRRGYIPSQKALITDTPPLIEPKEGEWPLLEELFCNLFVDEENDINQLNWFFPWLKHTIDCTYNYIPARGLALMLIGEPKCGKSLLLDILEVMLGRTKGLAYPYISGEEKFNKALFESVLQVIDDELTSVTYKERKVIAQKIKRFVAAHGVECRGMHKEGVCLNPLWRLVICSNKEGENLQALPMLGNDMKDKFCVFLVQKKPMPRPASTIGEQTAFFKELENELPAFLWHMLNEYRITEKYQDRFGSVAWCHPDIEAAIFDASSDAGNWAIIQNWIKHSGQSIKEMRAQEILDLIQYETHPDTDKTYVSKSDIQILLKARASGIGQLLMKVAQIKEKKDFVKVHGIHSHNRRYDIYPEK